LALYCLNNYCVDVDQRGPKPLVRLTQVSSLQTQEAERVWRVKGYSIWRRHMVNWN